MSGAQALANTLDLARLADSLGYHRYWVAEHHGGPMLAGPSPEVLIGPIAAATSRIRVGSGGVMLPHYSPFKVAESFSVLAGLFPGRVDLGLGRAAGTDPLTTYALQRDRREAAPDDFPEQLAELLAYLNDSLPSEHPFRRLGGARPGLPEAPVPWLLGSSPQSALWAAQLGLPYVFADFINPKGAEITKLYVDRFEPSDRLRPPPASPSAPASAPPPPQRSRSPLGPSPPTRARRPRASPRATGWRSRCSAAGAPSRCRRSRRRFGSSSASARSRCRAPPATPAVGAG